MFTVPSNSSAGSATLSRAAPFAENAAAFIEVLSAILSLLLHEDDAIRRTGNCASDVNQISFGVDFLDAKMRLCVTVVAVMARHLLSFDNARWISSWSNRSRPAVLSVSVSVRSAAKSVSLHYALKSASLRGSGDFHLITRSKNSDGDSVAEIVRRRLGSF